MASRTVVTVTTSAQDVTLTGGGSFVEVHCLADGGSISMTYGATAVSEADDMEAMAATKGATYLMRSPSEGQPFSIIASESVKVALALVSR